LLHEHGRPGRDGVGSNGSSVAHCASVKSNRFVTARVFTRSPVFRFFLVDEPTTGDLTYVDRRHARQRQLQLNLLETTSIQALIHDFDEELRSAPDSGKTSPSAWARRSGGGHVDRVRRGTVNGLPGDLADKTIGAHLGFHPTADRRPPTADGRHIIPTNPIPA
jgi:hypothetical protein